MNYLYLFYGTNRRKIEIKRNEVIKKLEVDELNISYFDMEETSYRKALKDAKTMPFLSDYRIIVMKNCYFFSSDKPKDEIDSDFNELKEYIKNPIISSVIIFECPYESLDHKKSIVKEIESKGYTEECLEYTKEEIERYIVRTLEDSSHKIESSAKDELFSRLDNDPQNFINEIKKLLLYLDDNQTVTKDIVQRIIIKDPTNKIFDLTNAIISKNHKTIIKIYYELIDIGYTSQNILYSIGKKFQEILYTKEIVNDGGAKGDVANYFKIRDGVAYYYIKNANSLDYKTLKEYLDAVVDLDYKIKIGQLDKDAGLELFLLSI